MNLLLFLLLAQIPEPSGRWKVSYSPETVLLKTNGESLFFTSSDVYVYDLNGNLVRNNTLVFRPDFTFLGPDDSVFVHDGSGLLGRLNENDNLQWQKQMPPPSLPPFPFERDLVYVADVRVLLLDPRDGSARYTLHGEHEILAVRAYDNNLLIAETSGLVRSWDPVLEKRTVLLNAGERRPRFMTPGPDRKWVMAYDDGRLEGFSIHKKRFQLKRRWHRDYHIDISVPPIWLRGRKEQLQLVVATQGRAVYVYGRRGEQLARRRLLGRPRAVIPWSESSCLIVSGLVDELLWYDAMTSRFNTQAIENPLILITNSGTFVLLVDEDGIIRLYQRKPPVLVVASEKSPGREDIP